MMATVHTVRLAVERVCEEVDLKGIVAKREFGIVLDEEEMKSDSDSLSDSDSSDDHVVEVEEEEDSDIVGHER